MAAADASLLKDVIEVSATVVVAAAGIALIAYVRRRLNEEPEPPGGDLLSEFQRAYDAGEIDSGEFRRVRESLQKRDAPPAPEARPTAPSPTATSGHDGASPPSPTEAGDLPGP